MRTALPLPYLLVPAVSVETELMCYRASRCVVFEHSSSGIRAGVGVGNIVVAVTCHSHGQLDECGPRFVVENLADVRCEGDRDERGNSLLQSSIELRVGNIVAATWRFACTCWHVVCAA